MYYDLCCTCTAGAAAYLFIPPTHTLSLNDITSVKEKYDLGVIVHESLKPSSHCAVAAKSCNSECPCHGGKKECKIIKVSLQLSTKRRVRSHGAERRTRCTLSNISTCSLAVLVEAEC